MTNASRLLCLNDDPDHDQHLVLDRGSTVLHAPSGSFMHDDGNGGMSLTVPEINGVAIADWAEVAQYELVTEAGKVTHRIRFHAGGEVLVEYTHEGELIGLAGEHTSSYYDFRTGVITFWPYRDSDAR